MHKMKRTNNDLQTTTQKTEDRPTRTTLKSGDEHMCSGMVSSSQSTNGTCRVTLASSPVMSRKWEKWIVVTTNGTYPWSCLVQILRNG